MNALNQAISGDVSRAYASIGRISHLRAQARCDEIARLSGGAITPTPEQRAHMVSEIQAEMIADATGLMRQTVRFFEAKHSNVKA
jgi:hypothetical protein